MAEILLVRHGQTEWNVEEVFRGRAEVDLNETGARQAELVGEYLRTLKIEAVYSSPLGRAIRTARAIARHHNIDAEAAPGLIDLDFGQWQGLCVPEVKVRYGQLYDEWLKHPEQVHLPGGESLADVRDRVVRFVNEVVNRHRGRVVLVSHRAVTKVLICALLGLDNSHFWNVRHDTCGVTTFNYEDARFVLIGHNDTCFLKSTQKGRPSDF
jgi:broad specificity phosphatase PhoE